MRAAQRLALGSDQVRADAVEVTGFPDLARKYRISGVPKSVFNERVELLGAAGEETFLEHALQAVAPAVS